MNITGVEVESARQPVTVETPGGYLYEEPQVTGRPSVAIDLPFEDAYDIILDGLQSAATIEPITPPTFKLLAATLLDLLMDESEDLESRSEVSK